MTLWQRILELLFPHSGGIDPLAEAAAKIANLQYEMQLAEMADDRYYTNGRRRRDLDELSRLKAEYRRLTAH